MESQDNCDHTDKWFSSSNPEDKKALMTSIFRECDTDLTGQVSVNRIMDHILRELKRFKTIFNFDLKDLRNKMMEISKNGYINQEMFNQSFGVWFDEMFQERKNCYGTEDLLPDFQCSPIFHLSTQENNNNVTSSIPEGKEVNLISSTPKSHRQINATGPGRRILDYSASRNGNHDSNVTQDSPSQFRSSKLGLSTVSICENCQQYEQELFELKAVIKQSEDINSSLQIENEGLQAQLHSLNTRVIQLTKVEKTLKELQERCDVREDAYAMAQISYRKMEIDRDKYREIHDRRERKVTELQEKLKSSEDSRKLHQEELIYEREQSSKLRRNIEEKQLEIRCLEQTVEHLNTCLQVSDKMINDLNSALLYRKSNKLQMEKSFACTSLPAYLAHDSDVIPSTVFKHMMCSEIPPSIFFDCSNNSSLQEELEACGMDASSGRIQQIQSHTVVRDEQKIMGDSVSEEPGSGVFPATHFTPSLVISSPPLSSSTAVVSPHPSIFTPCRSSLSISPVITFFTPTSVSTPESPTSSPAKVDPMLPLPSSISAAHSSSTSIVSPNVASDSSTSVTPSLLRSSSPSVTSPLFISPSSTPSPTFYGCFNTTSDCLQPSDQPPLATCSPSTALVQLADPETESYFSPVSHSTPELQISSPQQLEGLALTGSQTRDVLPEEHGDGVFPATHFTPSLMISSPPRPSSLPVVSPLPSIVTTSPSSLSLSPDITISVQTTVFTPESLPSISAKVDPALPLTLSVSVANPPSTAIICPNLTFQSSTSNVIPSQLHSSSPSIRSSLSTLSSSTPSPTFSDCSHTSSDCLQPPADPPAKTCFPPTALVQLTLPQSVSYFPSVLLSSSEFQMSSLQQLERLAATGSPTRNAFSRTRKRPERCRSLNDTYELVTTPRFSQCCQQLELEVVSSSGSTFTENEGYGLPDLYKDSPLSRVTEQLEWSQDSPRSRVTERQEWSQDSPCSRVTEQLEWSLVSSEETRTLDETKTAKTFHSSADRVHTSNIASRVRRFVVILVLLSFLWAVLRMTDPACTQGRRTIPISWLTWKEILDLLHVETRYGRPPPT